MKKTCRSAALYLFVVLLAFPIFGCESGVDVVVGEERPFTLWGILDAGADTQRVRVFTIEGYPGIDRSGGIDAAVVSTDLTRGEERTWNHRAITYEDGEVAHVSWSPFRAQPGHQYRLAVTRSDGATSKATVTVPEGVEFHFVVGSEAWFPPGGVLDPEVLVQPDAFSNVDNGYGFIGAGEIVRFRWTPVASVRVALGFVPPESQQADFSTNPPIPCVGENAEDVWDLFF